MAYVDRFWSHPEMYAHKTPDGWDDGWPHERDDRGWCRNCMAPPGCHHAKLVDSGKPEATPNLSKVARDARIPRRSYIDFDAATNRPLGPETTS